VYKQLYTRSAILDPHSLHPHYHLVPSDHLHHQQLPDHDHHCQQLSDNPHNPKRLPDDDNDNDWQPYTSHHLTPSRLLKKKEKTAQTTCFRCVVWALGMFFLILNICLLTYNITAPLRCRSTSHLNTNWLPPVAEKKAQTTRINALFGLQVCFLFNIFIYTLTYYITAPPPPPPRHGTTSPPAPHLTACPSPPPLPVSSPYFMFVILLCLYVYILCFLLCL